MTSSLKTFAYQILRKSEKYFKTDMVYFASGNFWLTFGRSIAIAGGFILTIALANLFTPTELGIYKYVLAIASVVSAFSLNGLPSAVLRAIGKGYQNVIPNIFRIGIWWSIPASVVTLFGALYYFLNGNVQLGGGLLLIAITNPLLSNLGISKVLFVGTGDFKRSTIYNIPRNLLPLIAIVTTLLLTNNVLAVIATYLLSNTIIGWLFYKISLKKLHIKDDPKHTEETLNYGKHQSIIGTAQTVVNYIDQLLLWHFLGPVTLAIYAIAGGPLREMRTLVDNFSAIAFPKIAQKSAVVATKAIPYKTKQLFIVLLVFIGIYIVLAPFMFKIFFPQYLSAVLISQLLMVSILFQPRNLTDTLIFAHGSVKDRYAIVVPGIITKLLLVVILIPLFGLMGAVIATILSELFNTIFMIYAYKKFSKSL